MPGFTQQAFFLPSGEQTLSATVFIPDKPEGAVLFVPPFCEERKGALPAFVQTARLLAERQVASLLFDFSGSGDSSGEFASLPPETFDADGLAAWSWLRQTFPNQPLAVLGLRTGALLASRIAAQSPPKTALIAWSPVAGPDFLRQLFQRRLVNDMLAYGNARANRAGLEETLRLDGCVDLDGYRMTGAFYRWAQALTPQTVQGATLLCAGGHDERTRKDFAAKIPHADIEAGRHPPFWNTVGHVDLTRLKTLTADWICEHLHGPLPSAAPAAASPGTSHQRAELLTLNTESAVRAILDKPSDTPCAGALFLHGWAGDRTGPHRLFTRFARHLTKKGVLCMRPDFTGRGLSDGLPEETSIARMTTDAQAALQTLRARLPQEAPITLIAICSGCKVAITLAADTPSLDRLILWSPESMGSLRSAATGWRKTYAALTAYLRKASRPGTWLKLLRGKVNTRLVAKALVKHETRSQKEAEQEDQTLCRFRKFRKPVLLIFGGSDPDAPGSQSAYGRFCRANKIPFTSHTIPHAGHSYYGEAWTNELFDTSLRFLSEKTGPTLRTRG